jgi:hypothetical protein
MEHTQLIIYPHCDSSDTVKNGHRSNADQRWRCNRESCQKSFQLTYRYNANNIGMDEQIEKHTLNSSGVRDTAASAVRPHPVDRQEHGDQPSKKTPLQVNPYLIDQVEAGKLAELEVFVGYGCQIDEFWSYVGSKANQRWT